MEQRQLEITIVAAKGLKDVGHFSKMDVYVAVTISGDPRTEQKTPVDKDGGSSPSWNYPMNFTVDEGAIQMSGLNLIFQLRHERTLLGDKDVGEVHVPVKELLDNAGDGKSPVSAEYPVRKPSGKAKGKLKFAYKFGALYKNDAYLVLGHGGTSTVYPPPAKVELYPPLVAGPYSPPGPPPPPARYPPPAAPSGGGYGYPTYPFASGAGGYGYPTSSGGGYAPPPQPVGYPPMAVGYGYPPVQQPQQAPNKNRLGSGLGAGLVGGLIGGMLIGDMAADYDAGFDDGGDF